MTTLANLRVKLSANTAALRKGLDRAKASLKRFAVGAAAAGAAIGALAFKGVKTAVEMRRMLSESTLGVKSFQKLTIAARQYGLEQQDVVDGLFELQSSLGDAADGAESKRSAFSRLGLEWWKLRQLSPAEAMRQVAGALDKVGDKANRTFLGNEILAGSFQKLSGFIEDYEKRLAGAEDVLAKYNIALSKDTIEKAAEVQVALGELGAVFDALLIQLTAEFGPAIRETLASLTVFLQDMVAEYQKLVATLTDIIEQAVSVGKAISSVATSAASAIQESASASPPLAENRQARETATREERGRVELLKEQEKQTRIQEDMRRALLERRNVVIAQ